MAQGGSLYRTLFKDAWELTWRNKTLWVLGFLAIFWGNIGSYSVIDRFFSLLTQVPAVSSSSPGAVLPVLRHATLGGLLTALTLTLLLLAALASLLWLFTVARGGLISALVRRLDGRSITVSSSLRAGAKHFWPLLGIGILSRLDLPLYLFLLPYLAAQGQSYAHGAFLLFLLVFIATTVTSLVLSFLGIYASAYVVLQGERFTDAVRLSLRLFGNFWLVSVELSLILYLLMLAVGVAFIVAASVTAIPFLLLAAIVALLKIKGGLAVIAVLAALLYLIVLLAAGSALVTFQFAAWTLLYLRLTEKGAVAKVVRMTSRFAHILHRKIV